MWEAYSLDNEDFLWAGIPFMVGISGEQQAPCGAVSASAVSLGLRHRCSFADKEKVKQARNAARHYAGKLVRDFTKHRRHYLPQPSGPGLLQTRRVPEVPGIRRLEGHMRKVRPIRHREAL